MAQRHETLDFSSHRDNQLNAKKIPSLVERGDWHKYVVLDYSAVFSSATTSETTGVLSSLETTEVTVASSCLGVAKC